jgi:hypothetical protein
VEQILLRTRTRLSAGWRTSKQPHLFSIVYCLLSVSICITEQRKLTIRKFHECTHAIWPSNARQDYFGLGEPETCPI